VFIELSPAQLSQVLCSASGGHLPTLLSGLESARETLAAGLDYPRLSGSLLCGLFILASFPPDGSYLTIKELARLTGRSPSTTHRYVSTLVAVGLVERDAVTREYRIVT
jgi:DNA-binding MarR family transcriptional regulator